MIEDVGKGRRIVCGGSRWNEVGLTGIVAAEVTICHARVSKGEADESIGLVVKTVLGVKARRSENPNSSNAAKDSGLNWATRGHTKMHAKSSIELQSSFYTDCQMSRGHRWVAKHFGEFTSFINIAPNCLSATHTFNPADFLFSSCFLAKEFDTIPPVPLNPSFGSGQGLPTIAMVTTNTPNRSSAQDYCCFQSGRGPSCKSRCCI